MAQASDTSAGSQLDALLGMEHYDQILSLTTDILARNPDDNNALAASGMALLRLNRVDEAVAALERTSAVTGMLAEAYGRVGRLDDCRRAGRRNLSARDRHAQQNKIQFPIGTPRQGGTKVISFSLFGNKPRYCEAAILNVIAARQYYPQWECRFHVDDTVPKQVLERILQAGGTVRRVTEAVHDLPATLWRYLALDDPHAEVVLFRDADSIVNERDSILVKEWLETGFPFHIVRDSFGHASLILAGLFGARCGVLPPITRIFRAYVSKRGRTNTRWADQIFLEEAVWPSIHDRAFTHDRFFSFGLHTSDNCGSPEDEGDHLGANQTIYSFAIPARASDGTNCRWGVYNNNGELIFSYDETVRNGAITISLPNFWIARLKALECQIRLVGGD